MSYLSKEKLIDLHERLNARIEEFELVSLPTLSLGVVRLLHDEIDEWEAEQDEEVLEDYANARKAAYDDGYSRGYFDAGKEHFLTIKPTENEELAASGQSTWKPMVNFGEAKELHTRLAIGPINTVGRALVYMRTQKGVGIRAAADGSGVQPSDIIALERDVLVPGYEDIVAKLIGYYVQVEQDTVAVSAIGHPEGSRQAEDIDDDTDDMPLAPDMADLQEQANHRFGHFAVDGETVPATAALIEKREPTEDEIAHGQELERDIQERLEPPKTDEKLTSTELADAPSSPVVITDAATEPVNDGGSGEKADSESSDSLPIAARESLSSLPVPRATAAEEPGAASEPEQSRSVALASTLNRASQATEPAVPKRTPVPAPATLPTTKVRPVLSSPVPSTATQTPVKPRGLDEKLDGIEGGGQRSLLWQVIDKLREMAVNDQMPTKGHWNKHKPLHMLTADGILERLKLSWSDLASRATLQYDNAAHKRAEYDEIVRLIQEFSEDGVMPTMSDWDRRKPEHLPKSTLLTQRHNVTWGDLAQATKLDSNRRNKTAA